MIYYKSKSSFLLCVLILIIPVIVLMVAATSCIALAKMCASKSIICAITVPFAFSLTPTIDQFYHSMGCRGYQTLDWQPFLRPAITVKIRERVLRRSVTPISHDHIVDPLCMWNQCANGKGEAFRSQDCLLWKVPSALRIGSGLSFSEHSPCIGMSSMI